MSDKPRDTSRSKTDSEVPDRESYYEAAADVWQRGCRGETLSEAEQERFRQLARDRFHTFRLSAGHARIVGDAAKIQSLIHSLALDLSAAPGLRVIWVDSEFSGEDIGQMVCGELEALCSHD